MKLDKKIILTFLFMIMLSSSMMFSNSTSPSLLVQGLDAYRKNDWTTALFFLRKAVTLEENLNPETWYVLIMSEVFAEDYESVITDGQFFINSFPKSTYIPQIEYQIGRAKFNLGQYNEAIALFKQFCEKNPRNELIPSALFWIAESLYQTYSYNESKAIFERILTTFPSSSKIVEVAFRLELLNQREREDKLLYLLKVTGEEYLSAREEYERQIKQYQSDEAMNLRKVVTQLNSKIDDLEKQLEDSQSMNNKLTSYAQELLEQSEVLSQKLEIESKNSTSIVEHPEVASSETPHTNDELELLKQKAKVLQQIIGER